MGLDLALEKIRPLVKQINNDYIQSYLADSKSRSSHYVYFKYIRSDKHFLEKLVRYRMAEYGRNK